MNVAIHFRRSEAGIANPFPALGGSTHVTAWDGGLHLGAGITTIRDMGNDNPTLLELMKQEATPPY